MYNPLLSYWCRRDPGQGMVDRQRVFGSHWTEKKQGWE